MKCPRKSYLLMDYSLFSLPPVSWCRQYTWCEVSTWGCAWSRGPPTSSASPCPGCANTNQLKSIPLCSPAGVVWPKSPAPPHHLGVTEVVHDLAQPGDGPGHVSNTLDSVVLSGDAHHTGPPSLTDENESNGKYFKPRRHLQPSSWWSPDSPGTVQIILGPHRHHTGSPALAPALTSADTPAPTRKIYLGLHHCLPLWFMFTEKLSTESPLKSTIQLPLGKFSSNYVAMITVISVHKQNTTIKGWAWK